MKNFNGYDYDTEEITKSLVYLTNNNIDIDEESFKDMEEALFNIKTIAENPYNREGYRTFIKVLDCIRERIDYGELER